MSCWATIGLHRMRPFPMKCGCAVSGAKLLLGISYKEAAERYVQEDDSTLQKPLARNGPRIAPLLARYAALELNKT